MTKALESLDEHIAWIQAQDARRDEEIRTLTARIEVLHTEKSTAAAEIRALQAARDQVAALF